MGTNSNLQFLSKVRGEKRCIEDFCMMCCTLSNEVYNIEIRDAKLKQCKSSCIEVWLTLFNIEENN